MRTLLLAIASILLSVAAQFVFKTGAREVAALQPDGAWSALRSTATNGWILLGFLLYGVGAVVWLTVLARWDVSKAYPLVGFGFALTMLVGFFAGETLTPTRVAGVLCICAGVALVSRT